MPPTTHHPVARRIGKSLRIGRDWPRATVRDHLLGLGFTAEEIDQHLDDGIAMANAPARDSRPVAVRMAAAMRDAVDRTGSATGEDLKLAGFTAAQVEAHGEAARAAAALMRPDAAVAGA